mmetsp:Transcript_1930/g.5774  ORF Transcript_1930/g.5774 Transcript_1930/m.5774 type:complete len:1750 (+) Transcript_1930:43-5292(+)
MARLWGLLGAVAVLPWAQPAQGASLQRLKFYDACTENPAAFANATVRFVTSRAACSHRRLEDFFGAAVVVVEDVDRRPCAIEIIYARLLRDGAKAVLLARGDGVRAGALYNVHDGSRGLATRHWGVPCAEVSGRALHRLRATKQVAPGTFACDGKGHRRAWRRTYGGAAWLALNRIIVAILAALVCFRAGQHAHRCAKRRSARDAAANGFEAAASCEELVARVEFLAAGALAPLLAVGLWGATPSLAFAGTALTLTLFQCASAFTLTILVLDRSAALQASLLSFVPVHKAWAGLPRRAPSSCVAFAAAAPDVIVTVLHALHYLPEQAVIASLIVYAAAEFVAAHAVVYATLVAQSGSLQDVTWESLRWPYAALAFAAWLKVAGSAALLADSSPDGRLAALFVYVCGRLLASLAKVDWYGAAPQRRRSLSVLPKMSATVESQVESPTAVVTLELPSAHLDDFERSDTTSLTATPKTTPSSLAVPACLPAPRGVPQSASVPPRSAPPVRAVPPRAQRSPLREIDSISEAKSQHDLLQAASDATRDAANPEWSVPPATAPLAVRPPMTRNISAINLPRGLLRRPPLTRNISSMQVQIPRILAKASPASSPVAAPPLRLRAASDAGATMLGAAMRHIEYTKHASRMAMDSFDAAFFVLDVATGCRKWSTASRGHWSASDALLARTAPVENLLTSQARPELSLEGWKHRAVGSRLVVHKLDWSNAMGTNGLAPNFEGKCTRKYYRATLEKITASEILVTLHDISVAINERSREVNVITDDYKRDQEARERRAESQMRAYVHHDIGNLLMGLCGIQLMIVDAKAAGLAPDDDVLSLFDVHLQTGREMLDSMVGITKLSDPDHRPPVERFEMEDLLEEVATLVRQRAAPGVEIVVKCDGVASVVAPRHYIKMVLFNLGGNAVKFTERGRITFSAAKVTARKCVVVVEDTGRGIPSDKLEKIRGLDGLALSAGRKGVGLAFVMQVCRKLFGAAPDIESSVGTGTRVSFVMEHSAPAPEATRGRAAITADDASQGPGETPFRADDPRPRACLVVDDYELNRRVLSNLLRSVLRPEGAWTIDEAPNGEAALALAATRHFDIVTLDFNMQSSGGTLTGAETATKLAALAAPPEVMIGITGSSAHDVERRQLLSAGCRYVWGKPPPGSAEASELLFGLVKKASRTRGLFSRQDSTPRVALICDDDAFIRTALTRMLRRILSENWSVITVTNGEEALANNSSLEADFILMDFHLAKSGGKLNGAETTALLLQRHPETKIVGITANAAPGAEEPKKLMAAGCLEVFGKPIQANVLEECIFSCDYMPLQDAVTIRASKDDKRKLAKSHAAASHVFDEPRAVQLHGAVALVEELPSFVANVSDEALKMATVIDVAARAVRDLKTHAHSLKGLAAMFSCDDLERSCDQLETFSGEAATELGATGLVHLESVQQAAAHVVALIQKRLRASETSIGAPVEFRFSSDEVAQRLSIESRPRASTESRPSSDSLPLILTLDSASPPTGVLAAGTSSLRPPQRNGALSEAGLTLAPLVSDPLAGLKRLHSVRTRRQSFAQSVLGTSAESSDADSEDQLPPLVRRGQSEPRLMPAPAPTVAATTRRRLIFIVDDQKMMRSLVSRLCDGAGVDSRTFEDGADVVAAIQRGETCDMILMDNVMPTEGPVATKAIRALGCFIPIVGLSGTVDQATHKAFAEAGANAAVKKPLRPPQFEELLQKFCMPSPKVVAAAAAAEAAAASRPEKKRGTSSSW